MAATGGFFGSGGSESSTTSTSSTQGAQTQQGSPTNVNISAADDIKGSHLEVNVRNEYVDPGALALAQQLGELGAASLDTAERLSQSSLDVAADFGRDAFSLGELSIDRAHDLAEQVAFDSARFRDLAVENATRYVENAYRFADDQTARVQQVATDAVNLVTTVADESSARAFAALADTQDFAADVLNDQSDFAAALLEQQTERAFDAAGQFLTQGQALLARESVNTEGRIEAITDKALVIGGVVIAGALLTVILVARR